jgi:cytidylate kinase
MPVITIRGKLGSWAPEIGRALAEKLHIDYIDREIIGEVSSRLKLQEQEVIAKETPPSSLRGRIAEALARGYSAGDGIQGVSLPFWQMALDDTSYKEAITSFITELARDHSAVIYGRGSQFILKDHPGALHVSVVAPIEVRLKRLMESLQLNECRAKQEMNRSDNSAREFMKRFFNAEMEDPTHYDLVINTKHFSLENTTSLITQALVLKQAPLNLVR